MTYRVKSLTVVLATLAGFAAASILAGVPTGNAIPQPSLVPRTVYQFRSTGECQINNPANDVWYSLCGIHLTIPKPGVYRVSYRFAGYAHRTDPGTVEVFAALSTNAGGAPSDLDLTAVTRVGGNLNKLITTLSADKVVTVAAPTTFYLNAKESSGASFDQLEASGQAVPTILRAELLG